MIFSGTDCGRDAAGAIHACLFLWICNISGGPKVGREIIAAGLDIGTTKVCTVVGHGDPSGRITITGIGLVPSRGMRKGVVIDVTDTISAVRDSVEKARHMAGADFTSVCAGVTGDHIQSSNLRGSVTIPGTEPVISAADMERVLQAAALEAPRDREIIHSLPRFFTVDGQRGVKRPIGMRGQRLEVETHVVTGTSSFLQNVAQCVEGANLTADALILEPIATAEAVATPAERDLGVALIDIGGGTSDLAVFIEGSIAFSGVITVGGNHVTRDISIGLRTPFEMAERLKIERGAASAAMMPLGEALEVLAAGSGERLSLPRAVLGQIIEARMTELLEMARDMLQEAGLLGRIPAGVILTGGGALLPGAIEMAAAMFQTPVRLGRPFDVEGWSDQVDMPQFATAVGLLRFALRRLPEEIDVTPVPVAQPPAEPKVTAPVASVEPPEAMVEHEISQPAPDDSMTPFDKSVLPAGSLDRARSERDSYYDPFDDDVRPAKPPTTWLQKALHRLRELIGFEMR